MTASGVGNRRGARRIGLAVGLDVVGSAVVLVVLQLTWASVRIVRPAPFSEVTADVAGRAVAPAVFGLALVTAAGAVAVPATRGLARRVVGIVVALAGTGAVVAAVLAVSTPSDADGRDFAADVVADRAGGALVPITDGRVEVTSSPVWPVLAAVAALLTIGAGVVTALPGVRAREAGLGARYEAPVAATRPRDASMWSALDHGDDPTAERPTPGP